MFKEGNNPERQAFLAFDRQTPIEAESFVTMLEQLCILTGTLAIKWEKESMLISVTDLTGEERQIIGLPLDEIGFNFLRNKFSKKAHIPLVEIDQPQKGDYVPLFCYRATVQLDSHSIRLQGRETTTTTGDEAIRELLTDLDMGQQK